MTKEIVETSPLTSFKIVAVLQRYIIKKQENVDELQKSQLQTNLNFDLKTKIQLENT